MQWPGQYGADMRRRGLAADRRGVTSLEYALIGSLIFLVIVSGVQAYAGSVTRLYAVISTAVGSTF